MNQSMIACITRLILAVAVTCALAGGTGCSSTPTADRGVRVGTNLPLTGDLATYGTAVRDGASLALDELAKSSPGGPKLTFDWQDNAGDPKNAVTLMQKAYLDPPDIYTSGVKPQTMAIMDQVTAKGTPHFVWIFDAYINRKSKNNFRTWVNYKIEPPMYLDYARARKARRIAVTYVQLPHTLEEFNAIVLPGLKEQGAEVLVESYNFGKRDFKDIALKFRAFKPDLIILNGFQDDLVGLVRALRPLKLIQDGNTIATYDMLDAAKLLGADEVEGIRVVAPIFVTQPDRPAARRFNEAFKVRYNREPLYTDAFAYDMVLIIRDAATRVAQPATPDRWIDALRATSIEGVTGPLRFDKDNDLATPLEVAVYRNGKLITEKEPAHVGTP